MVVDSVVFAVRAGGIEEYLRKRFRVWISRVSWVGGACLSESCNL